MPVKLAAFADEADSRLEGQIRALRENRISLLEIRGVDGRNIAEITATEAREIHRRLEEAGIGVWSIGSPSGKIGIADPFHPHLEQFKRLLETADILGASRFRLFSFYLPEREPAAAYRDEALERLSRFCEAAAGMDIRLCHENEKGIYGAGAAECADIHNALPALRAVFDPANFVQCGQDALEAWKRLELYVDYLHIKDAAEDGRVVPAGKGIGRLSELLDRYIAAGGEVVTLEPHLLDFDGFQALEKGEEKSIAARRDYPTTRAAFDAAAAALRALLR